MPGPRPPDLSQGPGIVGNSDGMEMSRHIRAYWEGDLLRDIRGKYIAY